MDELHEAAIMNPQLFKVKRGNFQSILQEQPPEGGATNGGG